MSHENQPRSVRAIVFYGPEICGDCTRVMKQFTVRGIRVTKVVVDSDHEAIAALRPVTGGMVAMPVVHVDGHYAFNGTNMAGMLDVIKDELALLEESDLVATP